jgi:hypothetical protein
MPLSKPFLRMGDLGALHEAGYAGVYDIPPALPA